MRLRAPVSIRAAAPGERVLAWATCAEGTVVATRDALLLPGSSRLPWPRIEHATWADAVLTVTTVDGETIRLTLDDPGDVPEVVRERVTSTVVGETHVRLRGKAGVLLVARRTETGEVAWSLRWDPGLDSRDPALARAAADALAATRSAWGV